MVGREDDPDWYEACNPVHGTKGLVPVNHFEHVKKHDRASGGMNPAGGSTTMGGMTLVDRSVAQSRQSLQTQQTPQDQTGQTGMNGLSGSVADGMRMSKMGRQNGSRAMVYGIVQYDFHAERSDELDAKAGEAIIVIAQSNAEWFVAKPITRLGGPGLIPVSFIEIRDTSTGAAVNDPQEAVQKANVPKVEEWKRMAANYKNSSIPLGKLGSTSNEGSARASVDSGMNGNPSAFDRNSTGYTDQRQSHASYSQMAVPLQARVPRYCHHEMRYWFVIEAHMDDGKHWELNREYTDFYALQTALMEAFPREAGKEANHERSLPFMPGPLPWVTERLTHERRDHMDRYVIKLLALPPHITNHPVVRKFFAPRDGDTVLESHQNLSYGADAVGGQRWSGSSSHQSYPPDDSRQSSTGNLSYPGTNFTSPSKSVPHPNQPQSPVGYGAPKQSFPPSNHQRVPSGANGDSLYHGNHGSSGSGSLAPVSSNPSVPKNPVKVKAYMDGADLVLLRLDEDFNFGQLMDKIYERWSSASASSQRFFVDYKNEKDGQYYSITDDPQLSGDQVLRRARDENGNKLTIRINSSGR